MLNEEQQIGMMLIAEGYRRENEDKSLITDRENEESEVLFLCLLLIRKKMYLIFSGMNEEAFCTLKLNKNNNGGYL